MRSLETAIESYFVDNRSYPPPVPLQAYSRKESKLRRANGWDVPGLFTGNGTVAGLTTPVAYATQLFPDRFAPEDGISFAYYASPDNEGWILFSPGPDRQYDLVPADDYDSSISQPSARLLLKTYDPTNGDVSAGDVWRVKQ
ncbi:MAG: hypothetical protein K1X53_04615 [Candidatus Sumerlaeaceae bacterium]|nr:hypothetical protein [Candidatus Sumerlaeaceae bacterium]